MGWVEGVKMGTDWYNERIEKERLARKEAQDKLLFDAKMEEMDREKRVRQQLGDAAKPAAVVDRPTVVDIGNGQKVYNMADSDSVAGSDARQARMMTERDTGQGAPAPVVQKSQFSMNGTPFADQATMQAAAATYNGPQAIAQRQAAVLNQNGNPLGAMQLQNTAAETKINQYKLSDAESAQANKLFNTHVDDVISKAPDGWTGLAKIATETQVGPMKGVNVRVQSDGKQMRFVATMPDGTERPGNVYENSAEGFARARNDLMKLDPDTKTKILAEQAKTDYTKQKDERDFSLKEQEAKSRADLRAAQAENQLLRTNIAIGKSGAGGNQPTSFNPLETFDSKKAQAVAFEQAAATTDPSGKPLTPEAQGLLAQKIYRSMEDAFANTNAARERARVFSGAASKAQTPEEISAVRERAKQSGYTDEEMARIDPRFKPAPVVKPPAPKPPVPTAPPRATMQSTVAQTTSPDAKQIRVANMLKGIMPNDLGIEFISGAPRRGKPKAPDQYKWNGTVYPSLEALAKAYGG